MKYWKNQPIWKQNNICFRSSPRSGKSTVFNILASCENVEGLGRTIRLARACTENGILQRQTYYYSRL